MFNKEIDMCKENKIYTYEYSNTTKDNIFVGLFFNNDNKINDTFYIKDIKIEEIYDNNYENKLIKQLYTSNDINTFHKKFKKNII